MIKLMTKEECLEFARHQRALNGGGTYYVAKTKRNVLCVVRNTLYRRTVHGVVVAIIGTA